MPPSATHLAAPLLGQQSMRHAWLRTVDFYSFCKVSKVLLNISTLLSILDIFNVKINMTLKIPGRY